jgi:hypothetical protein
MIETLAQLTALLASVQLWMVDPAVAWPPGRSWVVPVKYTITAAQLQASTPSCCYWQTLPGGTILRTDDGSAYLRKGPPQ